MAPNANVILSGFADEAAIGKTALEQLAVFAALGMKYYSIRFVDLGEGVKNVMKLEEEELARLVALHKQYDIKIATVGSPIGKVKLVDKADGTNNQYIPFDQYLEQDVRRAIYLAQKLDTKLIRGFSFYPPKGDDPEKYIAQTIDQIGQIAELCHSEGVIYGLELEANLVGSSGERLARIHRKVNSEGLELIFDGANLSCQNKSAEECYRDFQLMLPALGWMHVKDYKIDTNLKWEGHVDEERLKNFVPCDQGDSGHEMIFRELREALPHLETRLKAKGLPGFFLELEPHLKGGGQFGGFSGPDGMGVALRSLCRILDYTGISYELRDYAQLKMPS